MLYADVAKWQTRKVQVLMRAIFCRFKSCHPHQIKNINQFLQIIKVQPLNEEEIAIATSPKFIEEKELQTKEKYQQTTPSK